MPLVLSRSMYKPMLIGTDCLLRLERHPLNSSVSVFSHRKAWNRFTPDVFWEERLHSQRTRKGCGSQLTEFLRSERSQRFVPVLFGAIPPRTGPARSGSHRFRPANCKYFPKAIALTQNESASQTYLLLFESQLFFVYVWVVGTATTAVILPAVVCNVLCWFQSEYYLTSIKLFHSLTQLSLESVAVIFSLVIPQ